MSSDPFAQATDALRAARRVVVLSGAGMSAESGVPTFREAQSGLWEEFDPSRLATPEAWEADPPFVWAWYAWRVGLVSETEPNAGHHALAALAQTHDVAIITQNVDDLHERAGSTVLAHIHGSLFEYRCGDCDVPYDGEVGVPAEPVERLAPHTCTHCQGDVRPGVVWFGEDLPLEDYRASVETLESLTKGDVCLVVGTSGIVYPAAGMPAIARGSGATVIEINPHESDISDMCDIVIRGSAATVLPQLVAAATD